MKHTPVTQNEILNLLNLIRPWQIATEPKVRIGCNGDGGYVLPAAAGLSNLVLSIGISDEVSFDKALAEQGAKILQCDHTIPGAPLLHPNIRFIKQGWGPHDSGELLSLRTLISLMDWQQARHPILKFDTEGAEWDCLLQTESSDLARFEIITGEFHDFHHFLDRDFFEKVRQVWSKLALTHHVVHLHANNAGGIVMVGGIPMPRLMELSYYRQDAAVYAGHSHEPIPGPLDYPNMPEQPDICLRVF